MKSFIKDKWKLYHNLHVLMKILPFIELILCASYHSKYLHVLIQLIIKTTIHDVRTVVLLREGYWGPERFFHPLTVQRASYAKVSAVEFLKLCNSSPFILVKIKTQGNIFCFELLSSVSVLYNCFFADEAVEWLWGKVKVFKFIPFLKFIFYWRIIALQNFAVFCQTST